MAQGQPEGLGHALGHLVVLPVIRVSGPAVEAEPGDGDLGAWLLALEEQVIHGQADGLDLVNDFIKHAPFG